MSDTAYPIIEKSSISLSRNTPVALVVGAAGFIGSHLAEKLLDKNIQLIGVDDFSSGNKKNLQKLIKSSKFHLIEEKAQNLVLDVPRLDYIFIVANGDWSLQKILKIAESFKTKIVFVSSIELYGKDFPEKLEWFKQAEKEVAHFSAENKLNARVVRLSAIYGPGMHFRVDDPLIKLIRSSETLDFSTRALYIDDATDLIIKSMFSGATALKIFDGALFHPIKVDEVKQVMMDPVWYEDRDFKPTELPPWPTPNLEKTQKILNWQPQTNLIKALKETLVYFKENEIDIRNQTSDIRYLEKQELIKEWKLDTGEEKPLSKKRPAFGWKFPKIKVSLLGHLIAVLIIIYAIFYPAATLAIGALTFKANLQSAMGNLSKGRFKESLENIDRAEKGLNTAGDLVNSLEFFGQVSFLKGIYEEASSKISMSEKLISGTKDAVLGVQGLYQGLKAMTGEVQDGPSQFFKEAAVYLTAAETELTEVYLKYKVDTHLDLIRKAKIAAILLPEISQGKKSYLVLLQNNMELRPTGGFIGSVARVDFEGGKLKKIEVQDVYALDGGLNLPVEAPKDLKADLGVSNWYLRDSNWEPDFPTAARQSQWFYNKEASILVDGVVALDLTGVANLLSVVGPLELKDYGEKIDHDNLFERAVTYAEVSFFPGSEAKKNFLNSLLTALFNKMFFVPQQNWPGITSSIGESFEEKHFLIYLHDPALFSYIDSLKFSGALPRPAAIKQGELLDFISLVEANLGANKSNYYLDRKLNLETGIGKEGEINHRLRIFYENKSPSEVWPAGKYKNRMRIYLPFGAKLTRALWGEQDITKDVSSFTDYGRSGYSFLIELGVKEQKTLVLDWQLANKLTFESGSAVYGLEIIKQAGTGKDFLEWDLTFPISYKISLGNSKSFGPQEQHITTDLSEDRRFEVKLTK